MSTQRLFPDPEGPRTRPLGVVEPVVNWIAESTQPLAVAARRAVNAWYSGFPDPEAKLAARLRSHDDTVHHGALDELHIHHLLRQRYPDVRYEEGGGKPPCVIDNNGLLPRALDA